jgi:hypothetical protein
MQQRVLKFIVYVFRRLAEMARRKPWLALISAIVIMRLFPLTVLKVIEVVLSMISLSIVLLVVCLVVAGLIQQRAPRIVKVVSLA